MRAAIFIDGGYFLKQLHDAKFAPDYKKAAEYFLAPIRRQIPLDLLRCYFYYCAPYMSQNPTEDEKRRMAAHERFVMEIESIDRWQLRLGKLEKRREGDRDVYAQKRVDVQLSVDLVRHAAAGHIQHAVLVAGDSDFIPAVVAAKESGVTLTLWCGEDRTPHRDLLIQADEVQYLRWRSFPKKALPPPTVQPVQQPGTSAAERASAPAAHPSKSFAAPQQSGLTQAAAPDKAATLQPAHLAQGEAGKPAAAESNVEAPPKAKPAYRRGGRRPAPSRSAEAQASVAVQDKAAPSAPQSAGPVAAVAEERPVATEGPAASETQVPTTAKSASSRRRRRPRPKAPANGHNGNGQGSGGEGR